MKQERCYFWEKIQACPADNDFSLWTGPAQVLDRSWTPGHVQVEILVFHHMWHASGLEMTFCHNFHMILHGFASRNLRNTLKQCLFSYKICPWPKQWPKLSKKLTCTLAFAVMCSDVLPMLKTDAQHCSLECTLSIQTWSTRRELSARVQLSITPTSARKMSWSMRCHMVNSTSNSSW